MYFPPGFSIGHQPNVPMYGVVASAPPSGPPIQVPSTTTVFVGNIYERASDLMVKTMLQKCGKVVSWKRVQGASGKLQAFGFCEYEDPESTLRCIRLLNGFKIGDQELLVKVDQKTTSQLNEFRRARFKKDGGDLEEGEDDSDLTVVSSTMKADDSQVLEGLKSILVEYNRDLFVRSPAEPEKKPESPPVNVNESIRKFREQFQNESGSPPQKRPPRRPAPPPPQPPPPPTRRRSPREQSAEEGEDEEDYEIKRMERKLQEREAHYQAHLNRWKIREERRKEFYEREREHEIRRRIEQERNRRHLLRFLESYDDQLMDGRYYGGALFSRKFKERHRELSDDSRDRRKEREELVVAKGESEEDSKQKLKLEEDRLIRLVDRLIDPRRSPLSSESSESPDTDRRKSTPPTRLIVDKPQINANHPALVGGGETSSNGPAPHSVTICPLRVNVKHKNIQQVNRAFLEDDDDPMVKEPNEPRKLTLIEKRPLILSTLPTNPEEKKQAIKKIIESIPSETSELYIYPVDWDMVDPELIKKKIQPWIEKKIVEYIGEEEKTLVEFICQKITKHSAPKDILSDVRMVLDDEADVFLVKLWRLLIYETEARRNGLT